jgi:hypothetical protein
MISAASRLQPLNGNNHLLRVVNYMKRLYFVLLVLLSSFAAQAQNGVAVKTADSVVVKKYRVGIFANLYLDSSFTGEQYRFANQMPRHLLPGLDFVQGALLAVDSLSTTKNLEVVVYDLRSFDQSLPEIHKRNGFDSLHLMIGAVSGTEYMTLAEIAGQKNIPFVSATFPNDGGVTNNQFTIIVNSTLSVHCEALYNFVMRHNPTANIVYIRRKGQQEDRLATSFDEYNKGSNGTRLLKWKNVLLTDVFTPADIAVHLDSTKTNLIICGSLDENFGLRLVSNANSLRKKYDFELVGMPTWDAIKDLSKPEYKELPIFYSTTFYNTGTVAYTNFTKTFTDLTYGRPSDLAYKGFELSWHFINLLLKYDDELMQHLNERNFRAFNEYDFKPIFNKTSGRPNYFENKRVYILKRSSGLISRMN